jgi:hypothetical protein
MEHTAEWRRGKAEEFSNDRRNMEAAEELERLAKEVSGLDGSEISQRIDQLEAMSDDANYSMIEWLSEELRAVGFRTCYKDGAEFLKTYCERLEEEICEQEGQTLAGRRQRGCKGGEARLRRSCRGGKTSPRRGCKAGEASL